MEERVEVVFSESEVVKALEEVEASCCPLHCWPWSDSQSAPHHFVPSSHSPIPHHRQRLETRWQQVMLSSLLTAGDVLCRQSTSLLCSR